ncbi:hypothetical protein [Pseudomonas sp.]|jgi:hypothetical protein|uniref:hypothetical protein n=1 Tax=Pseudomonas sp. TaxID=306 RepID=UPI0039823E0A
MQISRLESFALEKLLQPQSNHALVAAQPTLRVLERVQTAAGFYSIIQLPASLRALQESTELEWPFKLKRLKAKGYFVCWAESETTLCLEAVISKGVCPPELSLEQFA